MATAKCPPRRIGVHTHASTHLQAGGLPPSHTARYTSTGRLHTHRQAHLACGRVRPQGRSLLRGLVPDPSQGRLPPRWIQVTHHVHGAADLQEGAGVMWGGVAGRWVGQRARPGMGFLAVHAHELALLIPVPSPSAPTRASFPSPSPAPVPSPSTPLACGMAAPTALATSACSGRTTRDAPGSVSPHSGAPPPTTTTGRSSRPGRMAPTREDS